LVQCGTEACESIPVGLAIMGECPDQLPEPVGGHGAAVRTGTLIRLHSRGEQCHWWASCRPGWPVVQCRCILMPRFPSAAQRTSFDYRTITRPAHHVRRAAYEAMGGL
jgi:hypothetical protein